MNNNTKNWVIGGFIIAVVILGYLFFNKPSPGSGQDGTTPIQSGTTSTIQNNCISAQEAWNHVGENLCVEYYVGSPYQSGKSNVFLNEKSAYTKGFTAVIFANSLSNFSNPISRYGNKTIQVTGLIKMYQGHPEIIVNSPSQIVVK